LEWSVKFWPVDGEVGSEHVTRMPTSLVAHIDAWAGRSDVKRPEAIRRLVELGLRAKKLGRSNRAEPCAANARPLERSMSLSVRRSMDTQTKREIWLLALGTIIVEMPFVAIAVAILSR
jgi:hypothetical protein